VTVEDLSAIFLLDEVKRFGPQRFKQLFERGLKPAEILADPTKLPSSGKIEAEFPRQIEALTSSIRLTCRVRAANQILAAHKNGARIITYWDQAYPRNVFASNNPVPVLYVRGSMRPLAAKRAIACVGSRAIGPPYDRLHADFVRVACEAGFAIVSGFALGADTIGHKTAYQVNGQTVCVMPCGLDRPFPPENRGLWSELLEYSGAVFVSEFSFGIRASSLTLRKRNKLIVAFGAAVLLSQSSMTGGAMNAYRFALEQHKPVAVFEADSSDVASGNKLIAEAIRAGGKVHGQVFPRTVDRIAYKAWLHELSYST
jgi:DNA processing protein